MESKKNLKVRNLFLALALLTWEAGGVLLCVMSVLLGNALLPVWLETIYMLLGGFVALIFMTLFFCLGSREGGNAFGRMRRHWLEVLAAELWILAIYYLWKLADSLWRTLCDRYLQNDILGIAVSVLLALGAVFAAGMFLRRLLKNFGSGRMGKGVLHILLTFGLLTLSLMILVAASLAWRLIAGFTEPSIVSMFAAHVFMACCEYGLLYLLMAVLCREKEEVTQEAASQEKPSEQAAIPFVRRLIGAGIPLAAILILMFLTSGIFSRKDAVEQAVATVKLSVHEGYAALREGNLEAALSCLEEAEGRIRAFRSLASEEAALSMKEIYAEYPQDSVVGALYLSETEDVETIEKAVRNYSVDSQWYQVLLRYYSEQGSLSGEQESLRDDLLMKCVAAGRYTVGDCVFTRDLRGNKIELRQELRDYEEAVKLCGVLRMVVRYGQEGTYTDEMAYEALDLAEENPDNLLMQYAACQIAGNFQEDGARHYQRTIEAAARFDRLYDDRKRTDAQVASAKRFLGNVAANCYEYETALGYYEESYRLSQDAGVALSCAKIYEKLEDYEQCEQMAESVLQEEADNTQALYLMMISALKTRNIDAALEAAGRLGNIVAEPDRNVDVAEENNLYVCAQYLSMKDSSRWTDYNWAVYDSLNEEQKEAAQSYALLWDYMTAINQCFVKTNYEEAAQSVGNILAVRDDLPMAWYLRGTIAFEQQDFRKALEYFGKAVDCGGKAPAIYFSIANAYDAMEDYENAWVYAKMVEEMLPYQDHGNDVYGISVHNRNLLNGLEGKMR